jgi:hypothetical protein
VRRAFTHAAPPLPIPLTPETATPPSSNSRHDHQWPIGPAIAPSPPPWPLKVAVESLPHPFPSPEPLIHLLCVFTATQRISLPRHCRPCKLLVISGLPLSFSPFFSFTSNAHSSSNSCRRAAVTPVFPKKTECISYVYQDHNLTHMIDS